MNATKGIILTTFLTVVTLSNADQLIALSKVLDAKSPDSVEMTYVSGEVEVTVHVSKQSIITTEDVAKVAIGDDPLLVIVELTPEGRDKMVKGTEGMAGRRLAVLVSGQVRAAPVLNQAPLGGQFHITGFKSPEEAKTLVDSFTKHLARADENTDGAVIAAKEWLGLIDAKDYGKSWKEAAPFFQKNVKNEQWVEMIGAARNPLGKVENRELVSAEYKTSLPNAPDGEYVVIQFKTTFAAKPDSIETITPMRIDGVWRVSGYFIR